LVCAFNNKFPTHRKIPILLENVIFKVESVDGKIIIHRRCKLNIEAPWWLKKIFGIYFMYFIQVITVDQRNKTLSMSTVGDSLTNLFVVNETTYISRHPDNDNWTFLCVEGTLSLECFCFGFEKLIEKFIGRSYSNNFKNARKLDAEFLKEVIRTRQSLNVEDSTKGMILRTLRAQGCHVAAEELDFSRNFSLSFEVPPKLDQKAKTRRRNPDEPDLDLAKDANSASLGNDNE